MSARLRCGRWNSSGGPPLDATCPTPRGGRRPSAAAGRRAWAGSSAPRANRISTRSSATPSATRHGSGARLPTISASRGSAGPNQVLDLSRGVEWSRWWTGGAFNYAIGRDRSSSGHEPGRRGPHLGRRGRRSPAADQRRAPRPGRSRGRTCSPAWASARATASASSCRCCPRRSYPCWRWES